MYFKTIIENTSKDARGFSWYNRGMDTLHPGEKRLLEYEPRSAADSQSLKLLFDEDVRFARVKVVYVTDAEVRKDVPDAQAFSIVPAKPPEPVKPVEAAKPAEAPKKDELVRDKMPDEGFFEGKLEDALPARTSILGENAPDTHSLGPDVSFEAMAEGALDPLKGVSAPDSSKNSSGRAETAGGKKTSGKVK